MTSLCRPTLPITGLIRVHVHQQLDSPGVSLHHRGSVLWPWSPGLWDLDHTTTTKAPGSRCKRPSLPFPGTTLDSGTVWVQSQLVSDQHRHSGSLLRKPVATGTTGPRQSQIGGYYIARFVSSDTVNPELATQQSPPAQPRPSPRRIEESMSWSMGPSLCRGSGIDVAEGNFLTPRLAPCLDIPNRTRDGLTWHSLGFLYCTV